MKTQQQKIFTIALWVMAVLGMVLVIGAGLWHRTRDTAGSELYVNQDDADIAVLGTVPDFSLVDQNDEPVTRKTLLGKPYVAAFVFTHCAGPCPMMTAKMSAMQETISDKDVQLVTVTVDPERDTPDVLKQYAKEHGADETRWRFLTGEKDAVFALAKGMLLPAAPAGNDNPILHSERFVLIDAFGQIRGQYESKDDARMAQLRQDAQKLAAQARGDDAGGKS